MYYQYIISNLLKGYKRYMATTQENPRAVSILSKAMEAVGVNLSSHTVTKNEYDLILLQIAQIDLDMERIRQHAENSMLTNKIDAFLPIANGL